MKVTLKWRDKEGDMTKWATQVITKDAEKYMANLATYTEKAIKENITTTSRLTTGRLADTFEKEQLSRLSWGIGDIDTLNKQASHWRHINYGSVKIGANWAHFLPKGFWDNGRWVENENGYAGVIPGKPIQAHNYIEKTIVDLQLRINQIISEK